jgi:hypothetical protein
LIFSGSILANLGLTRGWPETGFFREFLVVMRRFGQKPGFFVGVRKSYSQSLGIKRILKHDFVLSSNKLTLKMRLDAVRQTPSQDDFSNVVEPTQELYQ